MLSHEITTLEKTKIDVVVFSNFKYKEELHILLNTFCDNFDNCYNFDDSSNIENKEHGDVGLKNIKLFFNKENRKMTYELRDFLVSCSEIIFITDQLTYTVKIPGTKLTRTMFYPKDRIILEFQQSKIEQNTKMEILS